MVGAHHGGAAPLTPAVAMRLWKGGRDVVLHAGAHVLHSRSSLGSVPVKSMVAAQKRGMLEARSGSMFMIGICRTGWAV